MDIFSYGKSLDCSHVNNTPKNSISKYESVYFPNEEVKVRRNNQILIEIIPPSMQTSGNQRSHRNDLGGGANRHRVIILKT